MQKIEIYGTHVCPYCERAKALLRERDYSFTYHNVASDPEIQAEFTARTHGARTVPQIFIGFTLIGGFKELAAMDATGELRDLVALGE